MGNNQSNDASEFFEDLGDSIVDIWNETKDFIVDSAIVTGNSIEGAYNDAYDILTGTGTEPPTTISNESQNIFINNVVDTQWSRVNRAMISLYQNEVRSISDESSKRYRTMNSNYTLTQQDTKTIFVNIGKNDVPISSTIKISCACANPVNPLVIHIEEDMVDFVVLGDIRFPEKINVFSYNRSTNNMTRIELKNLNTL